jgi:hypothetical protein
VKRIDARGLDHIVHAVRDLEGAAELYRRLGFTVGARNRHSWVRTITSCSFRGFSSNCSPWWSRKLGSDGFSKLFGRFNQSFLSNQEGLSLLILESGDATADAATFHSAGVAAST